MRSHLPPAGPNDYDRPQQPWICGRSAEGDPCAFGPGRGGRCPALAECTPREVAGQWQCNRPATRGGPCDTRPTADGHCPRHHRCQPVRNLRQLRGLLVRSAMVFSAGVVLMLLGSDWRNAWIAPGELTSHHAQVLRGEGWNQRCSQCHAAADQTAGMWLSAVAGHRVGPTQSEKCMACHEETIPAEHALAAHTMPVAALRQRAGDISPTAIDELACAVCHQEHHGADHAIGAMDNNRCQACHTRQFESFATDHPELGLWPYRRRTPIAFSHTTHRGKHFAAAGREFACRDCHVEDASGDVQLTVSYERGCAECHDEDIATTTLEGVPLVTLPLLDVELLEQEVPAAELAAWPEQARGDFDGQLPAVMRRLLAAEPDAREAIDALGPGFDFFDVDLDDPRQLEAAATLATAALELLDELSTADEAPENSALARGLPPALVHTALADWRDFDINNPPPAAPPGRQPPGSWFVDDATLSIRYQPIGHADPVLKAWIDAAVSTDEAALRDALLAELTGPAAPGRCTTCHSIDEAPGGHLVVNWQPHDRRTEPRGFTRFSHAPHLLPAELRHCTACHAVSPTAETLGNYTGHNPSSFVSDFEPIRKSMCATCHVKTAVGDRCTQCHNYHVDGW